MSSAFRMAAVLSAALLCTSAAIAQSYPNKPIKAIVPLEVAAQI